jgi:large subunit ribosomal protein L18
VKTHGPRYHVKTRRHREGQTNYRKRLALLRSKKTRLVVRRSLKQIQIQFVEYNNTGDKILTTTLSNELKKNYNWKYSTSSIPAAYLTGLLAGKKALKTGIETCILDIGRQRATKGSNLFAAMKGVIDAGVSCPHNEDMIPKNERLMGQHIKADVASNVENLKKQITGGS